MRYLTIYSFSTENWKRPEDEVVGLMDLFAKTMLAEVDGLHEEGVRVRTIGDLSRRFRRDARGFDEAWEKTRDNDGMTLVVAVNYGGRQEILRACQGLHARGGAFWAKRPGSDRAHRRRCSNGGYTFRMPDPDLVIRTSGEMRISNFLLWQIAYSEFVVTDVLWPDFKPLHLPGVSARVSGRNRRFGGVPLNARGISDEEKRIEPERHASDCVGATMAVVCVRKSAEACRLSAGRRLLTG